MRKYNVSVSTLLGAYAAVYLLLCVWLMSSAPTVNAQEGGRVATQSLPPHQAIGRTLRGGETHSYAINLKAGDYFHVDVDQRGIDVELTLVDTGGKVLVARDRPNGAEGAEALSFIAPSAGEYMLNVRALEAKAEAGKYEIKSDELRTPTTADKKRIEAESLLQEGLRLSQVKTADSVKQACERYETSAASWREIEDKYAEALTLTVLGYGRESLEEYEKAVVAHERAATLYQELSYRRNEVANLNRLCILNARLQKGETAIGQCRRAKAIYRELKDVDGEKQLNTDLGEVADVHIQASTQLIKKGGVEALRQAQQAIATAQGIYVELESKSREALALIAMGGVNALLGERQKALANYDQALTFYRSVGNKPGEIVALTSIGRIYADLGDKPKALDYLTQALPLIKVSGDKRIEAITLNSIGRLYLGLGDKPKAFEFYNQSIALYRALGNKPGEVTALNSIGGAYADSGDRWQALEFYDQALTLTRALGDKAGEGIILNNIGRAYSDLGETRKALESFTQALPLVKAAGNKPGEAMSLLGIGRVYSTRGDKPQALDYLNQAMVLAKPIGSGLGEATVINSIGGVYANIGENQKALESYNLALSLYRASGDKRGEAAVLGNIGAVYSNLGESQKAIENHQKALDIFRAWSDRDGEAIALTGLGRAYSDLGEKLKALDSYNQALPLVKATGNRIGQVIILNNIAGVYSDIGDNQKALETFNQALPLTDELEDSSTTATLLNNIGGAYGELGENQKALEFYNRALPLRKNVESKRGEGVTLNNIGRTYARLGDTRKALEFYRQALPLMKAAGDKSGEAVTLSNMMVVWNSLSNARFAVFYGKLSVNAYQQLRSNNQTVADNELQMSLLKVIEKNYRYLANLLIEQDRLAEAQQVLNAFKDQQYLDFDPLTIKKLSPLDMTRREAELAARYEAASDRLGKIGSQIGDLRRSAGARTRSAEEAATLQQLEATLKTATDEFLSVIEQAQAEFSGAPDAVKDIPPDVVDARQMQVALHDLAAQTRQTAVAVYTVVGEKEFRALIITPRRIIPVVSPVKGKELSEKARTFFVQLSGTDSRKNTPSFPLSAVQQTGKELYDLVFAPIAAKLREFNIKPDVLMWSLDGELRYVPIAALYDGKQYLAERYRNVVFTRADSKQMLSPVSQRWTGTGFYTSRDHLVPVNGEMEFFPGLVNAKLEVETLFGTQSTKGTVKGRFLPDEQFTKDSLLERLQQHLALVHIASHFRLALGDASSSFLLLGDGKELTLADIKKEPEDFFGGVELLTLSACETGVQKGRESDGHEIDSFAELAQRKKAQAIMASLWLVDDRSTSRLMMGFYQNRELNKLTKAEALQKSQLSLLKDSRYSHPFYWSPFILIGNWR